MRKGRAGPATVCTHPARSSEVRRLGRVKSSAMARGSRRYEANDEVILLRMRVGVDSLIAGHAPLSADGAQFWRNAPTRRPTRRARARGESGPSVAQSGLNPSRRPRGVANAWGAQPRRLESAPSTGSSSASQAPARRLRPAWTTNHDEPARAKARSKGGEVHSGDALLVHPPRALRPRRVQQPFDACCRRRLG